jgi:tetratricopeptide (TPR) repeat protein
MTDQTLERPWHAKARLSSSPPPSSTQKSGNSLDAFISYAHEEQLLAKKLQQRLQAFAKPWYRQRRLNVFRDASHLVGTELRGKLESALDRSRYLVLLASPAAAGSVWVTRELQHWLRHHPATSIIIVLADGAIHWDEASGDFDWRSTDALPAVLKGALPSEPRWFPLAGGENESPQARAVLENAVADVACTITGLAKDELVGEDVRQHKRIVLLRNLAVTLLTLITLAASTLAVVAYRMYRESEQRLQSGFELGVSALTSIEELHGIPAAARVQAELSKSIDRLLHELSPTLSASDQRLRSGTARNAVFDAEGALSSGDFKLAAGLLGKAQEIYEAAVHEHKNAYWAVYGLSDVHDRKARLANMQGDLKSMGSSLETAVRYAEQANRLQPGDGALGGLEVSYDNLGMYYQEAGQLDKAEASHRKALALAEALFKKEPSIERRDDLVRSYVMLSDLAQRRARTQDELARLHEAEATLPDSSDPEAIKLTAIAIEIRLRLAMSRALPGPERVLACQVGTKDARELVRANASDPSSQLLMARMLLGCAMASHATGATAQAKDRALEAETQLIEILRKQPDYGEAKQALTEVRAWQTGVPDSAH